MGNRLTELRGGALSAGPVTVFLGGSAVAIILYSVWRMLYLLYFHPLARFPGPRLAAISHIYKSRIVMGGYYPLAVDELHQKYGPFVRISPNEISSYHPDAFKDVYGHRQNHQTWTKDARLFTNPAGHASVLTTTDPVEHKRMRRMLAHAFSARALNEQESIVQDAVTELITQLSREVKKGPWLDMIPWFNHITFDIIGELAFGESFYCVAEGRSTEWVSIILERMKLLAIAWCIRSFPALDKVYKIFLPQSLLKSAQNHTAYAQAKVSKRIHTQTERKDFMYYILKERESKGVSLDEMTAHASTLVLAGSETTATSLSGIFYYLLQNKDVHERLQDNIRSKFASESEINNNLCTEIKYLEAVIEEGLRIYPPVPLGSTRLVPSGGDTVGGTYIPEKTYVSVSVWSLTHRAENFEEPFAFKPERWLNEDSRFEGDKKTLSQPFLVGPRQCLGRNLAWLELRLIITRLIWNFDMELINRDLDWVHDQQSFILWWKPELRVQLKPSKARIAAIGSGNA